MLTRRGFLTALSSVPFMSALLSARRRFGPVDISRHLQLQGQGIHLHVFHQGTDVTKRCRFADDTGDGLAELFRLNGSGSTYIDRLNGVAARETVTGVELRAGAPFNRAGA